jgi:biopolymer transport protein TolR
MAKSGKHRFASDINVVPYIDVMLVLLVIFMVTAPLMTQGIKLELPKADAKPLDVKQEEPLIVSLKADGTLYLNLGKEQKNAKPLQEIQANIQKVISAKPATPVLIWADHKIDYGQVVVLMTQLEKAGVEHVGLVTEPL